MIDFKQTKHDMKKLHIQITMAKAPLICNKNPSVEFKNYMKTIVDYPSIINGIKND